MAAFSGGSITCAITMVFYLSDFCRQPPPNTTPTPPHPHFGQVACRTGAGLVSTPAGVQTLVVAQQAGPACNSHVSSVHEHGTFGYACCGFQRSGWRTAFPLYDVSCTTFSGYSGSRHSPNSLFVRVARTAACLIVHLNRTDAAFCSFCWRAVNVGRRRLRCSCAQKRS